MPRHTRGRIRHAAALCRASVGARSWLSACGLQVIITSVESPDGRSLLLGRKSSTPAGVCTLPALRCVCVCVLYKKSDDSRGAGGARRGGRTDTCVAGFISSAETIEECVAREVLEETGVPVDPASIRYVASQPWCVPLGPAATRERLHTRRPFLGGQLMIGCHCRATSTVVDRCATRCRLSRHWLMKCVLLRALQPGRRARRRALVYAR